MLTDTQVRALANAPPRQRTEIPDGAVKGLMLRVGPRGRPTWTLRYSLAGGGGVTERGKEIAGRKFFRISIGEYPTLSIKQARAKASAMLADAARGESPIEKLEERATARKGELAELAKEFLEAHVRPQLRSARNAEWVIRDYVIPRLGHAVPDKVKRVDVVTLLDDIARNATPTAAIETRKWLSSLYSWAIEKGRVESNPVTGVRPPVRSMPRERALSIDEARVVYRAALDEGYPSGSLICLLMLTGARLREIAAAKTGWLDRRNACLDIPGAAYKTGDATVIPLIQPALSLFEAMPRPADGEFLLSTTAGRRPLYTVTPKALIRIRRSVAQALGHDPEHWTLHDLRRTVATHMARLGVDDIVVERVLGHRIGGVKAVYNRYRYLDEKRAALELWAKEFLD